MKKEIIKCERCGDVLNPKRVKWLELSVTDGNYYDANNGIPTGHKSQGAFPFGTECATAELHQTLRNIVEKSQRNAQKTTA